MIVTYFYGFEIRVGFLFYKNRYNSSYSSLLFFRSFITIIITVIKILLNKKFQKHNGKKKQN